MPCQFLRAEAIAFRRPFWPWKSSDTYRRCHVFRASTGPNRLFITVISQPIPDQKGTTRSCDNTVVRLFSSAPTSLHPSKSTPISSSDISFLADSDNGGWLPDPPQEVQASVILQSPNPETLLEKLLHYPDRDKFIAALPRATFLEILRLLDPDYFLEPFKEANRFLNEKKALNAPAPTMAEENPVPKKAMPFKFRYLDEVFTDHLDKIHIILSARVKGGERLGVTEYAYWLNWARVTGKTYFAEQAWSEMRDAGIRPDTTCYNHLIETKCWSEAYLYHERQRLRVIPFQYAMRLPPIDERKIGFKGHRTGPEGLKATVLQDFKEMVENEQPADGTTFTLLMIAHGREGDLDGVKKILYSVWRIDVDAIMNMEGSDSEIRGEEPEPRQYPLGSLLTPTDRLLFVIAHVFCTNNEFPTALRLVDFVSQQYSLQIPLTVWDVLLEWSYVLSVRMPKRRKKEGYWKGQLPKSVPLALWQTMTADPYRALPPLRMYYLLGKNLEKRQKYGVMMDFMRSALPYYHESRRHFEETLKEYEAETRKSGRESPSLRRKTELAVRQHTRDTQIFKSWVFRIIVNVRYPARMELRWQRRACQSVFKEWATFLPSRVIVKTDEFVYNIMSREIQDAFEPSHLFAKDPSSRSVKYGRPESLLPESTIFALGETLRPSLDDESIL